MASIHDHYFKKVLSDIESARSFLESYLPEEVISGIDFKTLSIEQNSFIDKDLNEFHSDLLFSAETKGKFFVYFLLEHKSKIDKLVPFQLYVYMCRIWDFCRKQNKSMEKFPLIFPIVFYQGKPRWNVGKFSSLFEDSFEYIPDFKYELFDVSHMEIKLEGDNKVQLYLSILKFGFRVFYLQVGEIFNLLSDEDKYFFLKYVYVISDRGDKEEIKRLVKNKIRNGERMMVSIADELREEGIEKGIEKGKIRTKEIIKGIKRGDSNEVIHETTEASLDEIQEFRELILD